MRYKFIAAYKLIGVNPPSNKKEQLLVKYPSIKAKGWLVYNLNDRLFEFDRSTSVGRLMLKGLVGQSEGGSFEERLKKELTDLRDKRQNDTKNGVFAVFEVEGEVNSFKSSREKDLGEFAVVMDIDKQPIRDQYRSQIDGFISSLVLCVGNITSVNLVSDGVVFFNEKAKPVYSINLKFSAKGVASSALVEKAFDFVRKNAGALGKQQNLKNIARLLTKSMDDKSDELLSFLSVWSALEIFVNKNFKAYETALFKIMKGGEKPAVLLRILERIKGVMKDKYRLLDKFTIICFELSPDSGDDDINNFDRINTIRNKLLHGEKVDISSLPREETQKLLRKYLKLHLTRN